jgi:PPOX class probable F420-dependent enzyme
MMKRHIEDFVKQPRMGVLSTVSPTGKPHSTVIWYIFEADAFWLNVSTDSQKVRNIRRNPEVSLTIDERAWSYKEAVLYGPAEETELDEDQARRIAIRYLGLEDGEAMYRYMMENTQRVRLRLVPRRIYWQDFGG